VRPSLVSRAKRFGIVGLLAFLATTFHRAALAADIRGGWGNWWLPPNRSTHGGDIDTLFNVIFWITMITFVLVEAVLIVFMIKYRHRPGVQKAHFTHGNTRLEMTWTITPAIILAVLALFSKKVWDNYRYSDTADDPHRAQVLVVGEQFKWNVIYPGADGKFGRYLLFPKPTDLYWSNPNKDGKAYMFHNVKGPADLPYVEAVKAINDYIVQVNPLGKDFSDPAGMDDDWSKEPGRPIYLPANRPIEVQLSSKDVIHDFFLPNFRVKLDAVPGMRGRIFFTSTMTSKQREEASRKKYAVADIDAALKANPNEEFTAVIREDMKTEGAELSAPKGSSAKAWRYVDAKGGTIVRDNGAITATAVEKLKAANVKEIYAFQPGYWDLVC
jgi:heme/copper-type cytochrome/quinol oxidase subunit 2